MQKFILLMLILGLAFFLYLIKTGQIDTGEFNLGNLYGETRFDIRENMSNLDTETKFSDIYAIIRGVEYKVFTFQGDDFDRLLKAEYPSEIHKVPLDATDAITGTWLGNRYVFYILEKVNPENEDEIAFEIYKAEYPTDDISKLEFFKIRTVQESDVDPKFEVKY